MQRTTSPVSVAFRVPLVCAHSRTPRADCGAPSSECPRTNLPAHSLGRVSTSCRRLPTIKARRNRTQSRGSKPNAEAAYESLVANRGRGTGEPQNWREKSPAEIPAPFFASWDSEYAARGHISKRLDSASVTAQQARATAGRRAGCRAASDSPRSYGGHTQSEARREPHQAARCARPPLLQSGGVRDRSLRSRDRCSRSSRRCLGRGTRVEHTVCHDGGLVASASYLGRRHRGLRHGLRGTQGELAGRHPRV